MQKINNIITKAALTVLAAFLATGCIFEKMDMPEDLQSVLIQVNVSADEMVTKATATPQEKAINSLRIYAFYNGRLSGHFYRATASEDPIVMDLMLPLTGTHNVEFYVVANEVAMTLATGSPALTESTTKDQLAKLMFSSFSSAEGLPMYYSGTVAINVDNVSTEYNTAEGHQDHLFITDGAAEPEIFSVNVDLTRPIAKISFYAATELGEAAGVWIDDIFMRAGGTRQYGYLLPQTEDVLKEIAPAGTAVVDFLDSPSLIAGTSGSYDGYMYVFTDYFMEVPYGSAGWSVQNTDNSVVFDITYTGGTGSVYMPPIRRNTHYKVYCFFNSEGVIEVSYVVADWEDVEEWTLDFGHPTYSNPVQRTGNHNATGGPATMYFTGTEEGAFCVDFQMTAPAGQKWMPTFFGNAADYVIKVYETGTSTVVTPPVTVSDKWYTIKIIPLKQENVGSKVQFGITYTPSWTTDPEFLIINSGTVWNTAGSTEDLIVVQQVENNI